MQAEQAKLASGKAAHISKIHNISQSTSSGNIKVHLYREHKIDMDNEAKSEKNQQLIRNWCVENRPRACSAYDINRDILLWLCEDLESFNTVDKIGLRTFFHKNCRLDLTDRSTLSTAPLTHMHKSFLEQEKCELKSAKSATFDSWTDKYRKMPYLGIKLALFDFKIFTLSCTPLEYHTAENIKSHVKDIINDFFPRRSDQVRFHYVHD